MFQCSVNMWVPILDNSILMLGKNGFIPEKMTYVRIKGHAMYELSSDCSHVYIQSGRTVENPKLARQIDRNSSHCNLEHCSLLKIKKKIRNQLPI